MISWQVASFLILAAVLIAGFAWYERSRPTAQIVALVAALAALAVAGRVALVAIPNVVATTDVVVFAGYALGAAPGFAVGALAGLVANFWLGQGPWTPWQMAGWGMCGLLGALLALGVRNAGRFALAATCGLAAVGYGALLNFSLMATYGGELSLDRFLALESAAIPFDAAHAIGNVTLAIVAGPAIVRMLARFRRRFEWRMPAVATGLLLALAVAVALPAGASAASPDRASFWLAANQNADGGWGATTESDSAPDITAWAMLGLEAGGLNPRDLSRGERTPVSYLRANVGALSSPGDLARTILALHGAGVNPRTFGGRDLVGALAKRRGANGSYQGWPGSTAFAILALRAGGAGRAAVDPSISWLVKVQNGDGGWGDTADSASTADGTGAVMQAIPGTAAARQGMTYLRKHQRSSGGFPLGGSGGVNSQSTAWAVQGMLAVGTEPDSVRKKGKSPLDYLTARQEPDGHFRYSASSDQTPVWVTGQTLAAVAGREFPIAPVARQPQPKAQPTPSSPAPSGGDAPAPLPSTPPSSLPGLPGVPSTGSGVPPSSGGGTPSIPQPGTGVPPSATTPFPDTAPEGAEPEPLPTESAAPPFEASEMPAPKPWAPVGIGLASGGLALGGVIFLGRRFGW